MVGGLAEPNVPVTVFNFGAARVGDVVPFQGVEVQNIAAAPAEGQNAEIGTPTAGVLTNSGAIASLPPGDNDATSLQVGIDTASAGGINGTATITFESDGAFKSGTTTPLGTQALGK